MNTSVKIRVKAVNEVIAGTSPEETAKKVGVHLQTLKRWLNWYQQGGLNNLKRRKPYIIPHNRFPRVIEKRIFLLKEREPGLTLSIAKKQLSRKGIVVSIEGIRKIWQRYGLIGYKKEPSEYFSWGVSPPLETIEGAKKVEAILGEEGNSKKAARILNRLPCCNVEMLEGIPYRYLGLRRKAEKLESLFGKEPLQKFYRRVKTLRQKLMKKEFVYSALRTCFWELNSLFWLGKSEKMISLIESFEKKLPKYGDPPLHFQFNILKGSAFARMLRMDEALECVRKCQRLIKVLPFAIYQISLGNLYTNLGLYKKSQLLYKSAEKGLSVKESSTRNKISLSLATCFAISGEYQNAIKYLETLKQSDQPFYSLVSITRAYCAFGKGKIVDAEDYARRALDTTKKKEILKYIHTSNVLLAAISNGLGERKRARSLLYKMVYVLKKSKMMRDYYIQMLLLGEICIPEYAQKNTLIKQVLLLRQAQKTLRVKDYNKALFYAKRKALLGSFHRLILFFPEAVQNVLTKGKQTGLPRTILRLPLFSARTPALRIDFLGSIKIFRTEKQLRVNLRPKDTAFIIHLALSKEHCHSVDNVYRNFWRKSSNPQNNLSHMLSRLRKALKLSNLYLYTKGGYVNFNGYLTTDYQYFQQMIAQAKALLRAGEWGFAKREYLQAFKLFRGEPFKKMYDDWSDDKRLEILFSYEKEIFSFVMELKKRGRKEEAEKLLKKAERIVPLERD